VLLSSLAGILLAFAAEKPASASVIQVSAPSINSASPDLLDRGDFPALAGFAWDERMDPVINRRALTLSATPLGIVRAARGAVGFDAGESIRDGVLSRMAGRFTIGGPLQFVDTLRTVRAGRLTDHLTSELKLRLLGPAPTFDGSAARATTVAFALTADNLGTGYGLDRYAATLIAEREARCTWTANAGYRFLERRKSEERLAESKVGAGADWRWFAPPSHRGAVDASLSADCLLRNDGRDPVWQGGARVDVQVTDSLELSVAARRSDRPEIRGDPPTRGVLSVGYHLGGQDR